MQMRGVRPTSYDESARTDYLVILACLAQADGHLDTTEVSALRDLAAQFELPPAARAKVMASFESPPEELGPILERLSRSDLRYSLMTDLCTLAYVDGALVAAEVKQVHSFAEQLRVAPKQADALLRFAGHLDRARRSLRGLTSSDVMEARQELALTGIPLSAVAVSGSLLRLGSAVDLGPGWQ